MFLHDHTQVSFDGNPIAVLTKCTYISANVLVIIKNKKDEENELNNICDYYKDFKENIYEILNNHDIEKIHAERFDKVDFNLHEVFDVEETQKVEENEKIYEITREGYKYNKNIFDYFLDFRSPPG